MTTVAQGTTGTYTFAANEYATIQIDSNEQALVGVRSSTGLKLFGSSVTVSRSLGPFSAGDVMTITAARGNVDYVIAIYTPASVGVSTFAALTDAVTANIPTTNAATAAALSQKAATTIPWSMTTGLATRADGTTFTPQSGVFPATGENVLNCVGSGTQTLDGNTYSPGDTAEMSPANGAWLRYAAASGGGVARVSNFVAGTASTGTTTESGTLYTMTLGALVPGQMVEMWMGFFEGGGSSIPTYKIYINGTLAATLTPTAAFYTDGWIRVDLIVASASALRLHCEMDSSSSTVVHTTSNPSISVASACTITVTGTNSATGGTTQITFADARIFPA